MESSYISGFMSIILSFMIIIMFDGSMIYFNDDTIELTIW